MNDLRYEIEDGCFGAGAAEVGQDRGKMRGKKKRRGGADKGSAPCR